MKDDYIYYEVEIIIIHNIDMPITNKREQIATYHRYRGIRQNQLRKIINLNKNCSPDICKIIFNIRGTNL